MHAHGLHWLVVAFGCARARSAAGDQSATVALAGEGNLWGPTRTGSNLPPPVGIEIGGDATYALFALCLSVCLSVSLSICLFFYVFFCCCCCPE